MGFDVIIYNREGGKLELLEITEGLHNEIFNSKQMWRSYLELRKLSDYYLTDETFSGERLSNLISDLSNYKSFISVYKLNEYEELIKQISRSDISKVHIAGD
jgi:predicted Zn-dependent peptidase